jgi:hypothetical protein
MPVSSVQEMTHEFLCFNLKSQGDHCHWQWQGENFEPDNPIPDPDIPDIPDIPEVPRARAWVPSGA